MSIIKLSVCLHKQTIPYDHKKGSFFLPLTIISVASVINYVFKILFLDFFLSLLTFVTISLLFYVLPIWPQGIRGQKSPNTDQTNTPCAGGLSLDHWTTREIPLFKTLHPSSHMFIIIIFFNQKVVIVWLV